MILFRSVRRSGRVCVWLAATMFAVASSATAQPSAPPAVLFADVTTGPTTGGPNNLGVPIAIFGTGFGATRGSSTVTIGGVPVTAYLSWGANNAHNPTLDMIVVQPGIAVSGGPIVVTVGDQRSTGDVTFAANAGRIRYVSASGSDTAPCTESEPYATLTRAIDPSVSAPGDTILVRGAVHAESEVWVRREYGHGGTAEQPKTIKAYPGDSVVLSNGNRPFIVDADYVTVAGFHFQNGKSLGIPDKGDTDRRRGNRFINNTLTGLCPGHSSTATATTTSSPATCARPRPALSGLRGTATTSRTGTASGSRITSAEAHRDTGFMSSISVVRPRTSAA